MQIKPLYDNVLLSPTQTKNITDSGITLSPTCATSITSKVVAVGYEVKNLKINDQVLYQPHTAYKFDFNGNQYFLIKECDILAVIKEV